MKIGVVLAVYQAMDYLPDCLSPWILLKNQGFDFEIVCVHCCFQENHNNGEPIFSTDGTTKYLERCLDTNQIDSYCCSENPLYEHEARNIAIEKLLAKNVDFIWTIGVDEIFTIEQILSILTYISQDNFTVWFSTFYKNYVFNKSTWVDGFCPPRIFRVNTQNYKLKEFYWDDDIHYEEKQTKLLSSYKHFACKQIPKRIALINHYTWLSDERSKKKVEYQEKHFSPPRGAGCSFKWNYQENKLEFNLDYYKKTGQIVPELKTEFQNE
jgi:hypothetical protein